MDLLWLPSLAFVLLPQRVYIDGSDGDVVYTCPDGGVDRFPRYSIPALDEFLDRWSDDTSDVKELHAKLRKMRRADRGVFSTVKGYKEIYRLINDEVKKNIDALLVMILFSGLHFRWWKGPSDDYMYTTSNVTDTYDRTLVEGDLDR